MKRLSYLFLSFFILNSISAYAYTDQENIRFRSEIEEGLDVVSARLNVDMPDNAPGALGEEVYLQEGSAYNKNISVFVPTSMYVRMGAGLNLGFASDKASFNGEEHESSGSWNTQIGLGWNLSSYVRTEIDFQESTFSFSDLNDMQAEYRTLGGMLYFDFARRYIQSGDITYRRTFVPFMGIGAGVGQYQFNGIGGAEGFVIAAPRAVLGFNIMFNDLIGIDIMYQYQMMIGKGFGWNVRSGGVDNISNIMASIRFNF